MLTEQLNPKTHDIDRLSTLDMLTRINGEDAMVANAVAATLPQIAQAVDQIVARLEQGGRVIYLGAGTSGRLGVLDAVECVPTFGLTPDVFQGLIAGGTVALTQAVEGAEDRQDLGESDLKNLGLTPQDAVIGIAASGRTPYVLGGLAYANQLGALTIGLACNSPAPVLDLAQIPIAVVVGPEVIAGSTRMKSGTAQKMVLNMISTATMIKRGKVYRNLMVDVLITNEKLGRRARDIIMHLTGLDERAAEDLLLAAENHVKTALVMHAHQTDVETARQILAEQHGFLRPILEG